MKEWQRVLLKCKLLMHVYVVVLFKVESHWLLRHRDGGKK